MNEKTLGHFLKTKRTTADPAAYQIHPTARRRTPGLTRDELADQAHVSTDWVTRLEQGRSTSHPSPDVLNGLCSALRLTPVETTYVFQLAGQQPPRSASLHPTPALQRWLTAQGAQPTAVFDHHLTLLAANSSYCQLYGDVTDRPPMERNLIWRAFCDPQFMSRLRQSTAYAAYLVRVFRQLYSRQTTAPFLQELYGTVAALPAFDTVWKTRTVANLTPQQLTLVVPSIGSLDLQEVPFLVPGAEQVVLTQFGVNAETTARLQTLLPPATIDR